MFNCGSCCKVCPSPVKSRKIFDDFKGFVRGEEVRTTEDNDPETLSFYVPRRHFSVQTQSSLGDDADSLPSLTDDSYQRLRSLSVNSSGSTCELLAKNKQNYFSYDHNGPRRLSGHDNQKILEEEEVTEEEIEEQELISSDFGDSINCHTTGDTQLGQIEFVTSYDEIQERLTVKVEKASDLPLKGTRKTYDTYIKLTLVPSKKNCRFSRAIKNTGNPKFQEVFYFHLPIEKKKDKDAKSRYLRLTVIDFERQGRYEAIGHALLPTSQISTEEQQTFTMNLGPSSMFTSHIGQIMLSLCYLGAQGRLSITVIKGRNFQMESPTYKIPLIKETFDTYAKVTLMCGGEKVKTKRTNVITDSKDPIYNQVFYFVVPPAFLDDTSVVVTILMRGSLQQSTVLGRVISGPYTSSSQEIFTQWGQMLQNSKAVVRWRDLYM